MIGIALLVAEITTISRADDGRDFATKSKFTKIDIPGAVFGTQAAGINLQGDIVGYYKDGDLNDHGFRLSKGKVTPIDVPGSVNGTIAAGINLQGDIVGCCFESVTRGQGPKPTPSQCSVSY